MHPSGLKNRPWPQSGPVYGLHREKSICRAINILIIPLDRELKEAKQMPNTVFIDHGGNMASLLLMSLSLSLLTGFSGQAHSPGCFTHNGSIFF